MRNFKKLSDFSRKLKKHSTRLLFGFTAFLMVFFSVFTGYVRAESATNEWIGGYYYTASDGAWGQHSRKTVGGDEVFCVEPSVGIVTGEGYKQGQVSEIMSADVKDRIELIHHYGYTLSNKNNRDYVYTQTAIWEALGYYVNIGSYSQGNDLRGQYESWLSNINAQIDDLFSKPSWNGSTVKGRVGETIELDGENKIDNVRVVNNNNVVIEDGKIKINVTENSTSETIRFKKSPLNYDNAEKLTLIYEKAGSQTVAKVGLEADPNYFTINLEVQKEPTRARIKKSDFDDGKALSGATYIMSYAEDFTSEQTWEFTTGSDGWTEWDTWSRQGATVYVKEKVAPMGYELSKEVKSFVVTDGGEIELEFANKKKTYDVDINKTDLTDASGIEGATIDVFRKLTNDLVYSGITGKDGKLKGLKLPQGEYYFIEKDAPAGYVLNEEKQFFTVNLDGTVTGTTNLPNEKAKFEVKIKKNGETTVTALAGAKFNVFEKTTNKKVGSGVTDEKGEFKIKLPFGEYYFVETKAPLGYALNNEKQYFTISKNGNITGTLNLTNEKIPYEVTINKTDLTSGEPVENATIEIYNADTNELVYTGKSNKEGKLPNLKLKAGNYYFIEKDAPEGYILNTEKQYFTVNLDGTVTGTTNLPNELKKFDVEISKSDLTTGAVVEGATIEIYNKLTGKLIYSNKTDKTGKLPNLKLPMGEYYFVEKDAPEGYILNPEKQYFTVDAKSKITGTTNLPNEKITSEVNLIKKDTMNLQTVAGAEVEIKNLETGEVVFKGVTDENGQIKVKLRYGKYALTETIAPEGYVKAEKSLEINVTENGITIEQELWNKPITAEYILTKKDTISLKTVAGAEVEIKNLETGEVVFKGVTDEKGQIKVKLRYGKYALTETIAPKGYIKAEKSLEINVTENGVVIEQVLWNEPIPVKNIPKTAISSGTAFNLIMLVVAVGLGTLLLVKREQER